MFRRASACCVADSRHLLYLTERQQKGILSSSTPPQLLRNSSGSCRTVPELGSLAQSRPHTHCVPDGAQPIFSCCGYLCGYSTGVLLSELNLRFFRFFRILHDNSRPPVDNYFPSVNTVTSTEALDEGLEPRFTDNETNMQRHFINVLRSQVQPAASLGQCLQQGGRQKVNGHRLR